MFYEKTTYLTVQRIYLQRCKKIWQLWTLLCILIFCLTIQKRSASDPWRSFVTLFLHARRLKILSPSLSSLVVVYFETVWRLFTLSATSRKRLTITRAISRKLIWSGDGRLKYRKEWPFSCRKRKKEQMEDISSSYVRLFDSF